jgi:hypothetical protein
VFRDTGVVTADVEKVGRVDRTEKNLDPNFSLTRLGHVLVGHGKHVRWLAIAVKANGLHLSASQ